MKTRSRRRERGVLQALERALTIRIGRPQGRTLRVYGGAIAIEPRGAFRQGGFSHVGGRATRRSSHGHEVFGIEQAPEVVRLD